jgi:hypothetical protein
MIVTGSSDDSNVRAAELASAHNTVFDCRGTPPPCLGLHRRERRTDSLTGTERCGCCRWGMWPGLLSKFLTAGRAAECFPPPARDRERHGATRVSAPA